MRKGKKVATVAAAETNRQELARMMVGRDVLFISRRVPQPPGEVVFEADGVSYKDASGRQRLSDIHLKVHAGEIVGVAGVEGNGTVRAGERHHGLAATQRRQPARARQRYHPRRYPGTPAPDLLRAAGSRQDGRQPAGFGDGERHHDPSPLEPSLRPMERSLAQLFLRPRASPASWAKNSPSVCRRVPPPSAPCRAATSKK